jgi:D-3-phosphoglycerate dehydrogenase / 2-oxoglutarate reductase
MIRRAAGFGLDVVVWSRRFDGQQRPMTEEEARALGVERELHAVRVDLAASPAAVADRADILSVHLALGPETKGLVNADLLVRLKPGTIFINTARAEVVDYAALASAVKSRGLRVGLDVYANEPTSATGPFADDVTALPSVYGTHHIGASTDQAQEAIAAETVRIVKSYKETGHVPNVVNLAQRTPATHMLVVRHRDRPGVLAHVFDHLRRGNLNVQETENIVFEGAQAAVARINLDGEPPLALCQRIRAENADILDLQLVRL